MYFNNIWYVCSESAAQMLSKEHGTYFPSSRNVDCSQFVAKSLPQNFCQLKREVSFNIIPLWGQLMSTDWLIRRNKGWTFLSGHLMIQDNSDHSPHLQILMELVSSSYTFIDVIHFQ